MQSKTEPLIRTEKLIKTYVDGGIAVNALRGIDAEFKRREFTAIVGPSGSGKTTFLNVISGLDRPTSGRVWLGGKELSQISGAELSDFRRDHIGFIFQSYNLIPVLSVAENVEYVLLLQEVPKAERRRRVEEILAEVGLAGLSARLPSKLSGGQQQRVAIARAMVSRPDMILADEPTANLDSEMGGELVDMMRELNLRTGMTFVFSTHDRLIMEKAARVVTLQDGRIVTDVRR